MLMYTRGQQSEPSSASAAAAGRRGSPPVRPGLALEGDWLMCLVENNVKKLKISHWLKYYQMMHLKSKWPTSFWNKLSHFFKTISLEFPLLFRTHDNYMVILASITTKKDPWKSPRGFDNFWYKIMNLCVGTEKSEFGVNFGRNLQNIYSIVTFWKIAL